jgi:hypothetical protein
MISHDHAAPSERRRTGNVSIAATILVGGLLSQPPEGH